MKMADKQIITEYAVTIPLDEDAVNALLELAKVTNQSPAYMMKEKFADAMAELMMKAYAVAAEKKARDFRSNSDITVAVKLN